MPYSKSLAGRVRHAFAHERGIIEKRLFGGLGFLLHGNLCVCIWHEALIARVGPAAYEAALAQPHVREFDVTGRPMKGWVIVDPDALDIDAELQAWLDRALEFVATLPAK